MWQLNFHYKPLLRYEFKIIYGIFHGLRKYINFTHGVLIDIFNNNKEIVTVIAIASLVDHA